MNWSGPHSLTAKDIATIANLPGVYLLGKRDFLGSVVIHYVGRADSAVGNRLMDHPQEAEENVLLKARGCDTFYVWYAATAVDAFNVECQAFHYWGGLLGGLVNRIHPAAPAFSLAKCACEAPAPVPALTRTAPAIPTPSVPMSVRRGQERFGAPTPPSPLGFPTPKPLAPSISRRAEIVRRTANLMLRDLVGPPRPRFG